MPRLRPADRREAIVEAAVAVMLRKGIAATTVRDVAKEMGTSSGLIHHYFSSMDELLAAAFDRAASRDLQTTKDALANSDDPGQQLSAFFSTYVRVDQEWAFQLWLDAWAEAARRPQVRATSMRLNVEWQQLLVMIIRAGIQREQMRCADPEAAAWRILSLLEGLAAQAVAHQVTISRQQVIGWSVAHAELELGMPSGAIARPKRQKVSTGVQADVSAVPPP